MKKRILEEETYVEALEQIIQRDFYPDLPKLRTQLEWMEAEESGNIAKMREIQKKLKNKQLNVDSSLRETPNSFETPSSFTPQINNSSSSPTSSSSMNSKEEIKENINENNLINTNLDKFLSKHTSEDNASFNFLIEQQNKLKRQKYSWIFEKETKPDQLLLTGAEQQKLLDSSQAPAVLDSWKYTAKNLLMYHPDGVPFSNEEEKLLSKGPPKEIVHENTRIHGVIFDEKVIKKDNKPSETFYGMLNEREIELLRQKKTMKEGKIDLDELKGFSKNIMESPNIGGYNFLLTPSPAPGVDASPFTTWGTIDSTPLRLDLDTPLQGGPAFKVPELPKREKIAMELTEKVKKEKISKISTPKRINKLTPSPNINTDFQLRASYSSPSLKSKTPSPFIKRINQSPIIKTPSSLKSSVPPSPKIVATPKTTKSLTDNLLNI